MLHSKSEMSIHTFSSVYFFGIYKKRVSLYLQLSPCDEINVIRSIYGYFLNKIKQSVVKDIEECVTLNWCWLFMLLLFFFRYDVELYQRIEQLIGKKLPAHPMVEEEVMLLVERVTEAQRHAKMVSSPLIF